MLNIPYNNYKTQVCKFFEQTGTCQFAKNCTYAHGPAELRKPYQELPQATDVSFQQANPKAFKVGGASTEQPKPIFQLIDKRDEQLKLQICFIGELFRQNRDAEAKQALSVLL